ncbi:MAG TPA: hypothetical protein VLA72_04675 [Anaerolineales bacterium]|nr:hypothetical protein [Anaerolineales bacterium]
MNKRKYSRRWYLSTNDIRNIQIMIGLFLAEIALLQGIDSPIVWAFLGAALGLLFGQSPKLKI